MVKKNRRVHIAKPLNSNYTIKEQKRAVRDTLELFNQKDDGIVSFLGKNYKLISSDKFSILEPSFSEEEAKKLDNQEIIITTEVLKNIYMQLQKNPLNRVFKIRIHENNKVSLVDELLKSVINFKTELLISNIESFPYDFEIDSRMFYYFKLNLKTIVRKSKLYVTKNYILYENSRGSSHELYLIKKERVFK